MRHVPYSWYRVVHWLLILSSALVAGAYPALTHWRPELIEPLGLTITASIAGVVHIVYGTVGYYLVRRRNEWAASLASLLPFTLVLFALIHQTGGFGSWYYGAWLVLIAIAGMFGAYALVLYCFLATIYFVLINTGELGITNDTGQTLIALLASYAIAVCSYLLWRNFYVSENENREHVLGRELRAEQLKSEILISSITDGVVVFDTSGHIQLINPAGARMIGWKAAEATGLDYHSLFRFFVQQGKDEVELNDKEHPFQSVFNSGKPVTMSAVTLATRDEDARMIVSLSVSPVMSTTAEVSGAIAVYRDVSAEKRQERQRTEFISTASHEMRTPVAAIEGYLALALNEKVSQIDTKARDFLTKAHESTQHLGELFRDLLAASQSEEGRLENHPVVIELGEFIERLVEDARFSVEQKGLRLDFLVAPEAPGHEEVIRPLYYIHADPERIREVLTNLISNATKFTAEGGITLGLRAEPTYVQVSIKDTGIGIPATDIPHLFQKFYRIDNSATRTIGGTGLGLFICRNIIELYKGQIWAESELGKGSTFFVNLPRLSADQAEQLKKKESRTTGS